MVLGRQLGSGASPHWRAPLLAARRSRRDDPVLPTPASAQTAASWGIVRRKRALALPGAVDRAWQLASPLGTRRRTLGMLSLVLSVHRASDRYRAPVGGARAAADEHAVFHGGEPRSANRAVGARLGNPLRPRKRRGRRRPAAPFVLVGGAPEPASQPPAPVARPQALCAGCGSVLGVAEEWVCDGCAEVVAGDC